LRVASVRPSVVCSLLRLSLHVNFGIGSLLIFAVEPIMLTLACTFQMSVKLPATGVAQGGRWLELGP